MSVGDVTIEIDGNSYSGRLNSPDDISDRGILMIPGASHGPFDDIFDRFAEAAARNGHTVARFETWKDREGLTEKTESDFEAEIDAGIEFLQSRGCSTTTVVGKSLGGRLALLHAPDSTDRMVLWAPAVMFGHDDAFSIAASGLSEIEFPVRILQGNEDDGLSVENAATIAEQLPNGEVVELPGEDHSFLHDEQRIINETLSFLPE